MPISQLTERCWVLDDPPGSSALLPDGAGEQHWGTEREAREFAAPAAAALAVTIRPRQLDQPCWVIRCGGECDVLLDEEDENYIFHCASRSEAERDAAGYGWIVTRSGEVFCVEDAPDCAVADLAVTEQVPGQLKLGGTLGDGPGECPACGSPDPAERAYVPGATGMPVDCGNDWHDDDARGPGDA